MIEVELPDGTVAEFPDGTQDTVMEKALQQYGVEAEAKKRVGEMSLLRKMFFGGEQVLNDQGAGMLQIFKKAMGGDLSETQKRNLAVRRQMVKEIPGSWSSELVANVGSTLAPAGAIQKGVSTLLPKALGQVGGAAAAGGAVAAVPATLEGETRAGNAATGAAFGAGGQVLGNVAGSAIKGLVPKSAAAGRLPQASQDAATLAQLTDQNTATGRIVGSIEDKATSLPIVGSLIRGARDKSIKAWRDDAIKKGTPQGFDVSVGSGVSTRDQMGEIGEEFGKRYGAALKGKEVGPSAMFEAHIRNMAYDPKRGIPRDQAERIADQIIENYSSRFGSNAKMRATDAKDLESFLGKTAEQYRKGQSPLDPNLGKLYSDAERAWSAAYKRQLGPGFRSEIKPLDNAYGNFKTAERAAASVGNDGGAFSPAQLTNAVSARTGKSRFGRGQGFLAEEAQAGKGALQDRLPNSGTADRLLSIPGLMAGVPAAALHPALNSIPVKRALTGDTKIQKFLKLMRADQAAQQIGLPGGVLSQEFLTDESTRY